MPLLTEQRTGIRARWGLLLCCAMVLICYSNTFEASWHMDDLPNIIDNNKLKLETLSTENLIQTLFARPNAKEPELWRPLPCLSFALNYYLGGNDISGYHAVNIMIHLITASFLFLTIQLLLQTPVFKNQINSWEIHCTALLTTLLWAVNPIQIQAVTYIVQRMAAMAAMFTVIGLYAFLRGHLQAGKMRWFWYAATFLAFGCAMMSKENAVLFPLSIILIEWIFFTSRQSKQRMLVILSTRQFIVAAIVAFLVAGIFLHQVGIPINWSLYDTRPFTLWQRLISQPRILIFYLGLLFYPAPWRLSIEHDINHSLTLLSPWTTLPSILAVSGMIVAGFLLVRKAPLVSFAILFFFTNHLVESTILPLELVFEHRNYLPSFFVFLPIAFIVVKLLRKYRRDNSTIFMLLCFSLTCVLTTLGYACYDRNKVWKSDYNLWYDALQKAPGRARPLMALGVAIGWGDERITGSYDITIGILERALSKSGAKTDYAGQIYQNLALAHLNVGKKEKAFEFFEKALKEAPGKRKYRFAYIEALVSNGDWVDALHQLDQLAPMGMHKADDLNYKALVNLWLGKADVALDHVRQSLSVGSSNAFAYHLAGAAMTKLKYNEKGRWFLSRALELVEKKSRGKVMIYLSLMENRIAVNDESGAKHTAFRLLAEFGLDEIINVMKQLHQNHSSPPVKIGVVMQSFSNFLSEIAANIPAQVEMAGKAYENNID